MNDKEVQRAFFCCNCRVRENYLISRKNTFKFNEFVNKKIRATVSWVTHKNLWQNLNKKEKR